MESSTIIYRGGAEEACWAHNPKVGGSKPSLDKTKKHHKN